MKHDIEWFKQRKDKWIKRCLPKKNKPLNLANEVQTDVMAGNMEGVLYFFDLQENHEYVFSDTAETIAEGSTMDLEQFMDTKKTKPRVHISNDACTACEG